MIRRGRLASVHAIIAVALAGALVVAACGSRRSYDELVAAGSTSEERTTEQPVSASGDSLPGDSQSGDPGNGPSQGTVVSTVPGTGSAPAGSPSGQSEQGGETTEVEGERDAGASEQSRGCTGNEKPIRIATVGTQSGSVGATVVGGTEAIRAWVTAVNEVGGLYCHQVEYTVADDGGDPSRNRALVQQLVEEEGVIAFLFDNGPLSSHASVDYRHEHRIPTIHSDNSADYLYDSPYFFPATSHGDELIPGSFGQIAGQLAPGQSKVGILACREVAACTKFANRGPSAAESFGLEVVYNGSGSLAQPDFTSQCQSAKSAGAEALAVLGDGSMTQRVARSCATLNYRPIFFGNLPKDVSDDPNLDGAMEQAFIAPFMVSDIPGIAEYQQTMQQHAPGVGVDIPFGTHGWLAAKVLETAAQHLGDTPTSEDLLEGLYAIKNNDFGGLTYPVTYTRGQTAPRIVCWFTVRVRNGERTSPNDGKMGCR